MYASFLLYGSSKNLNVLLFFLADWMTTGCWVSSFWYIFLFLIGFLLFGCGGFFLFFLFWGSFSCSYRAFDEYEGIEVAWNQVKLNDFLQSPEELERLYCEIHLLKTLKHKNIMKFYASWVDAANRNINFVTEMFTSGTLRQ